MPGLKQTRELTYVPVVDTCTSALQRMDPIAGQTQVPATTILGFTFIVIMLAMLALVHTVRMCVHAVW